MSSTFITSTTKTTSSSSYPATAATDNTVATALLDLPIDILTEILGLLDGPSLASAAATSSFLHSLPSLPSLWLRLSLSGWPSAVNPRILSSFPNPFSFFSSASSTLSSSPLLPSAPSHHLISAVDLFSADSPVFSTVLDTYTRSTSLLHFPFCLDALSPSDPPLVLQCVDAAKLTLSWILIDPVLHCAANLSSFRPVSVCRKFFSREIEVLFATVVEMETETETETEWVQVGIVVRCGECEGELRVREVCMQVKNVDGMSLSGEDSLGILWRGLVGGKRKRLSMLLKREGVVGEEMEKSHLEFESKKEERKEKKMRREERLDMACIVFGFSIFSAFLCYICFIM